jgi:hypothetical protein
MKKGRFTIPEEDPTIYPHTSLFPMIYMRLLSLSGQQCFLWVNTSFTIETIEEAVNLLYKHSCYQEFTAAPS